MDVYFLFFFFLFLVIFLYSIERSNGFFGTKRLKLNRKNYNVYISILNQYRSAANMKTRNFWVLTSSHKKHDVFSRKKKKKKWQTWNW